MNLRYQICACLYQGTACEVFLVRDIVTSQLYALKRIVRHHAKFSDAYLRAVYQREACMLGWLQHERIPHLISAFEEEQYRCILMEYIPGVSLSRIQGCSSEQKRLQWCLQLGELLQYLHEQQIVQAVQSAVLEGKCLSTGFCDQPFSAGTGCRSRGVSPAILPKRLVR